MPAPCLARAHWTRGGPGRSVGAEPPPGLLRALGSRLVAEEEFAGAAASGGRPWGPLGRRRLSGPGRCGDGFLRFKTTHDVRSARVNVASALAELGGVDKAGQSGQHPPGSKGSVEDKMHEGKRRRVEGRADTGNSRCKDAEARWEKRREAGAASASARVPGLGRWSSAVPGMWRMCKIQAEASSPRPVDGGQGGTV